MPRKTTSLEAVTVDLAARQLLAQNDGAHLVEADKVERVLADVDADCRAIVIGLAPLHARAGDLDIRTVHGAVLCATPFQLRKAIVAAHRDEAQRVWQLGCMRAGRGINFSRSEFLILDMISPWIITKGPGSC
jgi:hypothetical protein